MPIHFGAMVWARCPATYPGSLQEIVSKRFQRMAIRLSVARANSRRARLGPTVHPKRSSIAQIYCVARTIRDSLPFFLVDVFPHAQCHLRRHVRRQQPRVNSMYVQQSTPPYFCVALTLFAIFLCLATAGAAAAQEVEFLFSFGQGGAGNGQFDQPYGIALDANGNIYVTETENKRAQIFDSTGNYQFRFGSGQFVEPTGIAIDDGSDTIYVTDYSGHGVHVLDGERNFQFTFGSTPVSGAGNGEFTGPIQAALGPNGDVLVTDWGNNRIQIFDGDGNYQSQFGSEGSGNGQFRSPFGIAIDAIGTTYVTDTNNHRVQVFDALGDYQFQFGSLGTGNGEFDRPFGIALDASGGIYVTEGNNHRVQVFDSDGIHQFTFGTNGAGNGEFDGPRGIVVDDLGRIYVADRYNHRVSVWQLVSESSSCDFDADETCGLLDMDLLYDEILAGTNSADFDLNSNGIVDNADIGEWLSIAGSESGKTYLPGDANLDGNVGGSDFTTLAQHFGNIGADPETASAYWRHGNFNGQNSDGNFEVGGTDFTALALHFGHVSVIAVPEPDTIGWLLLGLIALRLRDQRLMAL